MKPIRIEGHRGAGQLMPHNTIKSYQKAIDLGLDFIELDVHLTNDNVLAVVHGKRCTLDIDGVAVPICELNYQDIKDKHVIDQFDDDVLVPTLEETLLHCKNKIKVNIEIKGRSETIVEEVLKLVQKLEMLDQIAISSFKQFQLAKIPGVKEKLGINNKIPIGYIVGKYEKKVDFDDIDFSQGNSLNFNMKMLADEKSLEYIKECQKRGLTLTPYFSFGVDETFKLYYQCQKLGASSIIVNNPEQTLKYNDMMIKISNLTNSEVIKFYEEKMLNPTFSPAKKGNQFIFKSRTDC